MACDEGCEALRSGMSRYDRVSGTISYVLVCEGCGAEEAISGIVEYRPNPIDLRSLVDYEACSP
jgi:hypothetical protein